MKKKIIILFACLMLFSLTACNDNYIENSFDNFDYTNINESNYNKFLSKNAQKFIDGLANITGQTSKIKTNPMILFDDNWINTTTGYCKSLIETCDEVINYDTNKIPSKYLEVHEEYLAGAIEYKEMAAIFIIGIEEHDAYKIRDATQYAQLGDKHITRATELLADIHRNLQ